jgi:hypothetical protein
MALVFLVIGWMWVIEIESLVSWLDPGDTANNERGRDYFLNSC